VEGPGASVHWVRPVLGLAAIACLAELSYAIVNVLAIPVYVAKGVSLGAQVGVIMGAFLLAEALGRLWLGALSDRIGRKPLIIAGPLISAASALMVVRLSDPLALIAVRLVDGLGAAAFWPALFAAVGDATHSRQRSSSMGMLNVSYMVGLAFGPLAGGIVNAHFSRPGAPNFTAAFYLGAILFALTSLVALTAVREQAHTAPSDNPLAEERFTGIGPILRAAASVWTLLLVAFTTFLGIGTLIPVVELYALDKYGISQKAFGSLFLIPAVVIALAAVPLGRMGDRWGRLTSVKAGVFLCAVALWAVPSVGSHYILAAGAIVVGLGFLLAFPAWMALLTDVTDEAQRGSVLGAAGMAQGIGAITGAVLGGRFYHAPGPLLGIGAHDFPMYFAASCLAASFVLTVLLVREPRRA